MRCHACGRSLTRAAYAHPLGWVLGPICAEKPENLPTEIRRVLPAAAPKKRKRSAQKKQVKKIKQVASNDEQFDLFAG